MINQYPGNRKIVVVGAGAVGSTFTYALLQSGLAEEIALLDANTDQAKGQVLDIVHGLPFTPPVHIHVGDVKDYADAHIIVITAGAKQGPGESRLKLLQRNADIIRTIMEDICKQKSQAVVIIVSNPVDVLTYVALKHSGWPRERIIGSGTMLDSARFQYLLSEHCGVDTRNIHAYVLGEHGDSEVAAWSMTHIAGVQIDDYCAICGKCGSAWHEEQQKIADAVRDSAYHIINYKGATYYGIGLALIRIVGAILRNERSILTISLLLNGEYGLKDVCLSVPCVMSRSGVNRIITANLSDDELKALRQSADILKKTIKGVVTDENISKS
jgi:L-lactate dehydrogenase